jgi:aerotaxis receptor
MRNNQPVTQHEFEFPSSQMLVSATDLTGRIQYCNPAFIAVSGYTREELTGQPHNLIRHPDMPREAFADMWTTIRSGRPWSALVKNRRKNGDHYWVQASVTPVVDKGTVVGYLSVRVKPGRDEVRKADACKAARGQRRLVPVAARLGGAHGPDRQAARGHASARRDPHRHGLRCRTARDAGRRRCSGSRSVSPRSSA